MRGIIRYTRKQWGDAQVRGYIATLEQGIASLAVGQGFFKDMSALFPALRMARCEHHYVFCLPREGAPALIMAIFHERMDLDRAFLHSHGRPGLRLCQRRNRHATQPDHVCRYSWYDAGTLSRVAPHFRCPGPPDRIASLGHRRGSGRAAVVVGTRYHVANGNGHTHTDRKRRYLRASFLAGGRDTALNSRNRVIGAGVLGHPVICPNSVLNGRANTCAA